MINAIIGTKLTQSQAFTSDGMRIPVTRILAGPCTVVGVRTKEKDGYQGLCLGMGTKRIKSVSKPVTGQYKKSGLEKLPPRVIREIRLDFVDLSDTEIKPGSVFNAADIFKEGDRIQVTGISKGKGFQGVVKRHHFKGGSRTHGQSDRERAPGAIGQTTTPGRVYRGKRMAGRMGSDKTTIKNLKIISVDNEKNILTIKGLVPGGRNSLLIIKKILN